MADDGKWIFSAGWWTDSGRRGRVFAEGIDAAEPPPASVSDLPGHTKRQLRQRGEYLDAAVIDFQGILDTLCQMSRPNDALAHRVMFTLADFYRFRVEAQTPGPGEVPVSFSAGAMLALEDFFTRLACHGGFFSTSGEGHGGTGVPASGRAAATTYALTPATTITVSCTKPRSGGHGCPVSISASPSTSSGWSCPS